MRIPRLPHVVAALITLIAPLAVLAQAATNGTVTTAPLATAPAMGIPVLILLAIVLTGIAAYFLRPLAGRVIAGVGFVAVLTALTGIAYAPPSLTMVQGGQCAMQTTQMFDPFAPNTLVSHCQNAIQIVSIQLGMSCETPCVVLSPCSVGQILANGEDCMLPMCPPV